MTHAPGDLPTDTFDPQSTNAVGCCGRFVRAWRRAPVWLSCVLRISAPTNSLCCMIRRVTNFTYLLMVVSCYSWCIFRLFRPKMKARGSCRLIWTIKHMLNVHCKDATYQHVCLSVLSSTRSPYNHTCPYEKVMWILLCSYSSWLVERNKRNDHH